MKSGTPQLSIGQGWIVNNSVFQKSGGTGIYTAAGSSIFNSRVVHNGHSGISSGDQNNNITVVGTEISYNDQNHDDPCNDVAGLKFCTVSNVRLLNNYVHDNVSSNGLWCDCGGDNWTVQGNTVANNQAFGIQYETCSNGIISHNVVVNNGLGAASKTCGGNWISHGIFVSSSASTTVSNNNVSVPDGANEIVMQADNRNDALNESNNTFSDNTVTFVGRAGFNGFVNYCGASAGGPSCNGTISANTSNGNTFCVANLGDAHWNWNTSGFTRIPWASYQSRTGRDGASTLKQGNCTVPGCTSVGCTGSGW